MKGGALEGSAGLKNESGKGIVLFCNADAVASLLEHALIDEYRICLVPQVHERGKPSFKPLDQVIGMKLLKARPCESGAVILRYSYAIAHRLVA